MFTVREIESGEGPALRKIRLAALSTDPTAFARSHDEEASLGPEHWEARAAGTETSRTFVAVDGDGTFIGLAGGYQPEPGAPVELVSMWTAPPSRGRGVARGLVEAVVDWATDLDPPSIDLWVTRGNDAAFALYESCGFAVTDEIQPAPNDPCREEIRMRRPHRSGG